MTVTFTRAAYRDMEEIVDYLNEQGESARLFLQDVSDASDHLSRWPDTGARRSDLSANDRVRCWLIEPHQLIYLRQPDQIRVLAVMHTARHLRSLVTQRLGDLR